MIKPHFGQMRLFLTLMKSMVVDKLFYIKQTEADMKAFKDFIEHDKTS